MLSHSNQRSNTAKKEQNRQNPYKEKKGEIGDKSNAHAIFNAICDLAEEGEERSREGKRYGQRLRKREKTFTTIALFAGRAIYCWFFAKPHKQATRKLCLGRK